MRVLITGSRGQIGQSFRAAFPEDWELIATDSKTLDITNAEAVDRMIGGFQPDVVLNAAAYTNPHNAQSCPEKVFAINAYGVRHLSRAAYQYGSRFIHLSSDQVFSGQSDTPYSEDDAPSPINVYGQSKLAGELLAMAENPNSLIIRTSTVFSVFGQNIVSSVVNDLKDNKDVSVSEGEFSCPTYALDLVVAIMTLLKNYPEKRGLLHYSGEASLSKLALVQHIAKTAVELGLVKEDRLSLIHESPMDLLCPQNTSLKNSAFPDMQPRSLDSALHSVLIDLAKG